MTISEAVSVWHSGRIAFLSDAPVIAAAVMETETIRLAAIGGIPCWMRSSPRNVAETLEREEDGLDSDVLYVVTLRLRFRPGWTNEQLNWDDLRDDVPHVDVTKKTSVWRLGYFRVRVEKRLIGFFTLFAAESEELQNCPAVSLNSKPHNN